VVERDDEEEAVVEKEVAHTKTQSPCRELQPPTLASVAELPQLRNIHVSVDIISQQRYDDRNETIVYINDVQYIQGEILERIAYVCSS